MRNFAYWKEQLLEILFPPICSGCRAMLTASEKADALCAACVSIFVVPEALICPICRGRIPRPNQGLPPVATLCHPHSSYIVVAAASYEQPVAQALIQQLKFERRSSLAKPLGSIATRALAASAPADALLVPVPLSTQRLRERGFNQAALIAAEISAQTGLQHLPNALIRTKNTETQTTLKTWRARANNLQHVFTVAQPNELTNKVIILVDDVWTSGATMGDAARALKEAGAKRILGLVICRAH